MDRTAANMERFFTGLKTSFNEGFKGVETDWSKLAFTVPSQTSGEDYAWMGDIPDLREWIGSRVIKRVSESTYQIRNKDWEGTLGVPRNKIDDDSHGVYGPLASGLGKRAAQHPGKLVTGLVASGFDTICYDGQSYFDEEHPVIDPETGEAYSVSNMQAGDNDPWFLFDTSQAILPIIFQERQKPNFQQWTDASKSEHVFMNKEYVYGVDARYNVGWSFWQFGFGSKKPLTAENLRKGITEMKNFKGDEGELLGIKPDLLVVGASNAFVAKDLLTPEKNDNGASNTNKDLIKYMELPYLA